MADVDDFPMFFISQIITNQVDRHKSLHNKYKDANRNLVEKKGSYNIAIVRFVIAK